MAIFSTTTKAKLGTRGVRVLATHPQAARFGFILARPVAKRRAERTLRETWEVIEAIPPMLNALVAAGQELGLIEKPKRQPVGLYVLAGALIGAAAVTVLKP
jgi:predicted nuclease with RNAse H fold